MVFNAKSVEQIAGHVLTPGYNHDLIPTIHKCLDWTTEEKNICGMNDLD